VEGILSSEGLIQCRRMQCSNKSSRLRRSTQVSETSWRYHPRGSSGAAIFCAQQYIGRKKHSKYKILTKEMEEDLRADFTEIILKAFW
jgi:RNase P/RNase MRP subunit POP5